MCYSCGSQSQRLEKDQTLSISLHMVMLDEAGGVPATEALVQAMIGSTATARVLLGN